MNARPSFLRASLVPAALATAIGLAFAISAPAQAQYTYPGNASSAGHSARISPMRAGARQRAEYGGPRQQTPPPRNGCNGNGYGCGGPQGGSNSGEHDGGKPPSHAEHRNVTRQAQSAGPARAGMRPNTATGGYSSGNPSMQKGEACPPGSMCATPVSANGGGGSGSRTASDAYGARESYGTTAMQSSREANAVRPVAAGGRTSVSPVRSGVGRGALNHGPMQNSNANFRNSVTGTTSGPNMNITGQATSVIGPDGKQVTMGNPTSFTGPNGQKQSFNQTPDLSGAGYGHQKGSGINNGVSYTTQDGSMTEHITGTAPGMASAHGMNLGNGGVAGVSDQPADAPSKPTGKANSGGQADGSGNGEALNAIDDDWGHPANGKDSQGNDWSGGKLVNGFDDKGVKYRGGKPVQGGNVPGYKNNSESGDMGPNYGPGEIVSGTGQVVHPGQKPGQDTGGGQTDDGTSHSGGQNAQGQYVAPSGQDNIKKPKEAGLLKVDYNGKRGAIDPKLNGSTGGGG